MAPKERERKQSTSMGQEGRKGSKNWTNEYAFHGIPGRSGPGPLLREPPTLLQSCELAVKLLTASAPGKLGKYRSPRRAFPPGHRFQVRGQKLYAGICESFQKRQTSAEHNRSFLMWVCVNIRPPGYGSQVLVHVSIYQGSILGTHFGLTAIWLRFKTAQNPQIRHPQSNAGCQIAWPCFLGCPSAPPASACRPGRGKAAWQAFAKWVCLRANVEVPDFEDMSELWWSGSTEGNLTKKVCVRVCSLE